MTEDKIKKSGFKKYLLIGGAGFIALIAVLAFVGELLFRNEIKACNRGGEEGDGGEGAGGGGGEG